MQQCRRPRAFVRLKGLPVIELRIKLFLAGEAASLEPSTSMAGVDLGVNSRLALSDGTLVEGSTLDRRLPRAATIEERARRRSGATRKAGILSACVLPSESNTVEH